MDLLNFVENKKIKFRLSLRGQVQGQVQGQTSDDPAPLRTLHGNPN